MAIDIIARGMASNAAKQAQEALDKLTQSIEGTINSDLTEFKDSQGNIVTPDIEHLYHDTATSKYYRWNGVDKFYEVSEYDNSYVKIDGSTAMKGNLKLDNHRIVNLGEPVESGDAVNKRYVDNIIETQISAEIVKEGYYDETTNTFFQESKKINPIVKSNNKLYKDLNTGLVYALKEQKYNCLYLKATSSNFGLIKLYNGSGINEDGTMTQKAITQCLNNITAINEADESLAIKIDF